MSVESFAVAAPAETTRRPPRFRAAASAALAGLAAPVVLTGVWWVGAEKGWVPDQILPPPGVVFEALRDNIIDGALISATWVSLLRVVDGFAVGAALGLLMGGAIGASRILREIVEPTLLALAQVPHLAWMPILILLTGIGEEMKIILIAWSAFLPVMLGMAQGVRDTPKGYLELGRVLAFDGWTMATTIVLPSALPSIFTGVREGLANAWQALVIVELVASFEGLGYQMAYGRQLFQLELVLATMIIIAAIGLTIHAALSWIEIRLSRWRLEGVK